MTIRELVNQTHQQLSCMYPEREIESFLRILLKHHGITKSSQPLLMLYDSELPAEVEQKIHSAIAQLENNRPIQYILGETEFYGLSFELTPDVLIPRPETEELVDWIVREYEKSTALKIVDIGAGSGCIAVSLKKNFQNATVWAVDVSKAALSVSQRNTLKNRVQINHLLKNVLTDGMMGFEHASLDVIVSNPPYVTESQSQQMAPNVLDYEPYIALFVPEKDPLVFFKSIAVFGKKCLKKGGKIYFEINEIFNEEVADILKTYEFSDIYPRKDINGKWRMISAKFC